MSFILRQARRQRAGSAQAPEPGYDLAVIQVRMVAAVGADDRRLLDGKAFTENTQPSVTAIANDPAVPIFVVLVPSSSS
ncbi:MAG: hypothetical protein WBX19_15945 [Terracidiphilus sp.]